MWLQKSQQLWRYSNNHILSTLAPLTLMIVKQCISQTFWLMVMDQHTKFGYKMFWRYHLDKHSIMFLTSLWPWPWPQQSNLFTETLQFMMMCHQTNSVAKGSVIRSAEDTTEIVILILSMTPRALAMTLESEFDLEDSNPIFFALNSGLWFITIPSLVTKSSAVQKKSIDVTLNSAIQYLTVHFGLWSTINLLN